MKSKVIVFILLIFVIGVTISIGFILNRQENQYPDETQSVSNDYLEENNVPDNDSIIQIRDETFIYQVNTINIDRADYLGQTIKVKGFVYTFHAEDGRTIYSVARNTPGCHHEGIVGFIFKYDGEIPKEGKWIEITGTLEEASFFTNQIDVIIRVTELELRPDGGIRLVTG